MQEVEIERGHRGAVKHGAEPAYNDKINAAARQNSQYLQEPGNRILHGV
jgi:hypothetical protein